MATANSMIRWRTVCCCTAALLLLSSQVQEVSSQDNAAFTKPITQLVNDLSMEFSNIVTQNLGVDTLEQAFQGSDVPVFNRQSLTNAEVTAKINNTKLRELYDRIIQLLNETFTQGTARLYSEELVRECCDITDPQLNPCCHQCQSQSESDRNYLITAAGVLNNGSTFLFNDFNSIQVRFEVGHRSGALIEVPGINIGILGDCTTRSSFTQDWYESTINATGVVIQSVRSSDGGFFLSIAMASNGMVARALVKMTDLYISLVEMLERRPSSYWFVINSQEDIFYYPQLPVRTKNVPIRQLEGELHSSGILNSMTRSESNEGTLLKTYLLAMGPSVMYGYVERSIMSTYIYQPILTDNSVSLSICVILAEEDRNLATIKPINPQDIIGANTQFEPFYHYSFATGATDHKQCSYYCQSASKDALSVYLTDPSDPPLAGDSMDLSTMVNLYLENGMNKPDWIQEGVATEAARASVSLNPVWTSQSNTGINSAISWRYATFPSGLLLNHPAVKIDPDLQFSDLPWYNRALAHPGLMTLSPAVPDPRRTGLLYSISKALSIPDGNTATVGGPILSVVAGDISLSSLHVTINSMEPLCTQKYYSCFLIDSAGMIIYHPSYLTEIPSKVPSHITTLHPRFYSYLVSQGNIIEKDRCNDYYNSAVNVSERSYSMFQLSFSDVATNNNTGSCDKYQFARVPDTNVFLAIEYSPNCPNFFCSCRLYESSLQTCASCPNNNPPSCDCPCTCHRTPNNVVSSVRSCPFGPTEQPPNYSFDSNAPSGLGLCYNHECRSIKDQNTCNTSRECTWCFTQCTRLADCCEDSQANLLPNCVSSVCRNTNTAGDDDVSSGAIAGAVVGVIFVILVIGCLILVLVWYNFIRKEDPNAPKQENEFDFSKSRSSSDTQSQEPLSKKAAANKTNSRVEERDSNGANIVTPDTIQLSNPLYTNNTTNNNKTEQQPAPMPETDL